MSGAEMGERVFFRADLPPHCPSCGEDLSSTGAVSVFSAMLTYGALSGGDVRGVLEGTHGVRSEQRSFRCTSCGRVLLED